MYYDGTQLLSKKDLNGNRPEIYICTSNRCAGKTVFFNRLCVNCFKNKNEKFMLLYRYKYELSECHKKFFDEIQGLFFSKDKMTSKVVAKGNYVELYLNDKLCGFATALNCADNIKKYSHVFKDVTTILQDEFQSENNQYTINEIAKFISIHTTVARGGGQQSRYVRCILVGNPVSLINPYYLALNIGYRLQKNTHFLRGNGWVLEQGFNKSASNAQQNSIFNKAFADNKYIDYNINGIYLNDDNTFLSTMSGTNIYICSLYYNNIWYNLRYYPDTDILYTSTGYDKTYPLKYTVKCQLPNIPLFSQAPFYMRELIKNHFNDGLCRFKDLNCKEVIFNTF